MPDIETGHSYDSVGGFPHDKYFEMTAYGSEAPLASATGIVLNMDTGNVDQVNNGGLPWTCPYRMTWDRWSAVFRGNDPAAVGGIAGFDLYRNGVSVTGGVGIGFVVNALGVIESAGTQILGTAYNTILNVGDLLSISGIVVPFVAFPWDDAELRIDLGFKLL